ncbi:MAG: hypothetical protein ACR2OZ_04870 [Verrucomicrobiales bacterium]
MSALYDWLYRDLSLRGAGIFVGVLLIVLHGLSILRAKPVMGWLKKLPRHKMIGIVLLTIDLIWAWVLVSAMDMGEFWKLRKLVLILLPITYALMIIYVDEFLAPRAAGILLLLAACPVLDAAFLELPLTRLLLPLLAYVWIVLGMFWVGMPYLMRDHIAWASASERRWKGLAAGGATYGVLLCVCALVFWGK